MLHLEIESELQQEVEEILREFGISADHAVTMLYEYVRNEHRLPSGFHVPNAETRAVFESTDAGEDLIEFATTEELFTSLGI
jgi:antitoxin component of RelBE/YafQ-DinJ toxin-antitoxin module